MTNYKLHCFKESCNSYKVALALSIAGLPWEKVNEQRPHAPPRAMRVHPFGPRGPAACP